MFLLNGVYVFGSMFRVWSVLEVATVYRCESELILKSCQRTKRYVEQEFCRQKY